MTNTGGESRPEELKQQQPPASSSSVPEELLGFTPASELYSVGIFHLRVFLFFLFAAYGVLSVCICGSSR